MTRTLISKKVVEVPISPKSAFYGQQGRTKWWRIWSEWQDKPTPQNPEPKPYTEQSFSAYLTQDAAEKALANG